MVGAASSNFIIFIYLISLILLVTDFGACLNTRAEIDDETYSREFLMPNVRPTKKDQYICTALALNTSVEEWVLRYDPLASANRAHHMLLYGCSGVAANNLKNKYWDCGHHGVCRNSKVMYAWAKNAPATNLPKDVGYRMGGDSGIKFLTLQIHYAQPLPEGTTDNTGVRMIITQKQQKYKAGIYLLLAGFVDIPPLTPKTHADINCMVGTAESDTIHVFAFRTHAHKLGSVISGYKLDPKTNELTEIAKGNPQWPQAFYPMKKVLTVRRDEYLHARCTFNSSTRNRHTYIGSTSDDEMCNLYLMYYTDRVKGKEYGMCFGQNYPQITKMLPASSDEPLPYNPLLEEMTHGENTNKNKVISYDKDKTITNPFSALTNNSVDKMTETYEREFLMPGVTPTVNDAYVCVSVPLNKSREEWILGYDPLASANRAHHMLLFGCSNVANGHRNGKEWDCGHHGVCEGGSIMYAWGKNAPATNLPKDVGFRVGGTTNVNYLVLQIHYAKALPSNVKDTSGLKMNITTKSQKYIAGIYLLAAGYVDIAPHVKNAHADVNCRVGSSEPTDINIFAYRVHAHKLGTVITGYKYNTETYELIEIVKGNPQWPQAFYPMSSILKVTPGELLHARCTYNSINRATHTYIGATSKDEMCNLYLMYYTDAKLGSVSGGCATESYKTLTAALPASGDDPLPRNLELEEQSQGENKNTDKEITYDILPHISGPIEIEKKTSGRKNPTEVLPQLKPKPVVPFDNYDDSSNVGTIQYYGQDDQTKLTPDHVQENLISSPREGKHLPPNSVYDLVADWGPVKYEMGQVTAVAIDSRGDVVVFHRGTVKWDGTSFNSANVLLNRSKPIAEATLLHLQRDTGHVMHQWGANFFYMPHGLSIDGNDNIWLTDVGMHQVFKFPPGYGDGKPNITLGTKFKPGNDDTHFCKPSAIAILKNGEFFIADGYCNARIIHYSATGDILKQFGEASKRFLFGIGPAPADGTFNVPHSLTIVEDHNEICVSDRENGRIQCFDIETGDFRRNFKFAEWGSRLFAAAYTSHNGGRLLAVNGPQMFDSKKMKVFEVSYTDNKLINSFSPYQKGMSNPHDLTLSEDGSELYVVEIGPNKIWKFVTESTAKRNSKAGGGDSATYEVKTGQLKEEEEDSSVTKQLLLPSYWTSVGISSVVIGLLVVPILVLSIVAIAFRCHRKGSKQRYFDGHKKNGGTLTLGSLLNKRRGFEQVATNDIDEDDLDSADSEVEEFSLAAAKV